MADDSPAYDLVNEIDRELRRKIPLNKYTFLIIPTPINNIRKTKTDMFTKILEMVECGNTSNELDICSTSISISIYDGERKSGKKVIAALPNKRSSVDIRANVDCLLQSRIRSKERKRKELEGVAEYWLALINEYWIADERTYQASYESLGIGHGFDKVLIVNDRKGAYEIYCKT